MVAVKTLNSRMQEDIQKFLEEAELMKKFSHPNIVSILGKGSSQNSSYGWFIQIWSHTYTHVSNEEDCFIMHIN